MPKILPVVDSPASRQEVILEDVAYGINLVWNERAGAWSFGLDDRDGQPILAGRRVVLQLDLFYGYRHLPGMPSGFLYALDTTKKLKSISRDDLILGRAVLQYYTQAEVNAL